MYFGLTDSPEIQGLREEVRAFVEKEVEPLATKVDQEGMYPEPQRQAMIAKGWTGLAIPKEYGGQGASLLEQAIVVEELAKSCPSTALILAVALLGPLPLVLYGTEEQKQKYLPRMAKGELQPGFALTEPVAGSDAAAIQTSAVLDGDEYVLNGHKTFVGNCGHSNVYCVAAKTDPDAGSRGITAFLVEADNPGFKFGGNAPKMGINGQRTGEFYLENCRVKKEDILGQLGKGFKVCMGTLDQARIGAAAGALGIAERAIAEATAYANERKAFGQSIGEFQAIMYKIADAAESTQAAKLLTYRGAAMFEHQNEIGRQQFSAECAMAKHFSSENANKVCYDMLQVFGGRGYMKGNKLEQLYRDARVYSIFEGTSQIQQLVIGRTVLGGGFHGDI